MFDFISTRSKDLIEELKLSLIAGIESINHEVMLSGCKLIQQLRLWYASMNIADFVDENLLRYMQAKVKSLAC